MMKTCLRGLFLVSLQGFSEGDQSNYGFFFFKNICTVEHYWCCKLPVQPRREKWTYGAPKDEDNDVFWRCERVINNPNIFVFSDILRADTMPFSRHSLWVYVSVFPPRSGVDNCWQLLQLLQRERLQFNLGSLDVFIFFLFSQTEHSSCFTSVLWNEITYLLHHYSPADSAQSDMWIWKALDLDNVITFIFYS